MELAEPLLLRLFQFSFIMSFCLCLFGGGSKSQPFSFNMLKIVIFSIITLGLNYFLFHISNPLLDGIVRLIIAIVVFGSAVYFLKISAEMNDLIKASLKKGVSGMFNIFNKKG